MPRLHERTRIVQQASTKITKAIVDVVNADDLSYMEVLSILGEEIQRWTRHGLRQERHPENPGKRADEA